MSKPNQKILILGGTKEAAELAKKLVEAGHDVTTSLAGITHNPAPVKGKVRIGGFSNDTLSGAKGMAQYLEDENFDHLIDATHPFAKQISQNAKIASNLSGVPLEIKPRSPWLKHKNDQWIEVNNIEGAISVIPKNATVFLALGSKYIDIFKKRPDVNFIVRMVDKPNQPLRLAKHKLIFGKPNAKIEEEKALFNEHNISHIICRNSGGIGSYAKIEAARELKIPVIIIGQN